MGKDTSRGDIISLVGWEVAFDLDVLGAERVAGDGRGEVEILDNDGRHPRFVLVGGSAGGFVAHLVAEHLERDGRGPSGVALLDTFETAKLTASTVAVDVLKSIWAELIAAGGGQPDDHVTALHWYTHDSRFLFLEPRALSAPTLHIRATEPYAAGLENWQSSWALPHTAIYVPGNHFSLPELDTTSQALDEWIDSLLMERAIERAPTGT